MRYILTIKAKRKDARRHIAKRDRSIENLRHVAKKLNSRYITEIYTGNWNFVERIEKKED